MHVVDAHALVEQVVGKVFGHALGKGGNKHTLLLCDGGLDLVDEVVNLALDGAHLDLGVQKPRRADDLLHALLADGLLVVARRRAHVDELRHAALELVEAKRTVVERRREAEAVLHQRDLARAVTLMHAADLRHRHVALVDDAEHVLGEVVDQGIGRLARLAAVEVARVVLDAVAEPHGLEHLEVVGGALCEALGLEELVGSLELGHTTLELLADSLERAANLGPLGHVVRCRPDGDGVELADDLARDVVDLGDELDLVSKEAHAQRVLGVWREHIHGISPHAEGPAREVVVVAVVLDVDERLDEVVALERLVLRDVGGKPRVVLRAADAVDTAHRSDHDHVAAREQA